MNVLFLTLSTINSPQDSGIYADLIKKFSKEGNHVYVVKPIERRWKQNTSLAEFPNMSILSVKTLNIRSTNVIEKGFSTLTIGWLFGKAIKKHLRNIAVDLILYSTPPISFTNLIRRLKHENSNAKSYLILKDIFPQNAVDLGMLSKKSLLYLFFRNQERSLYKISDYIGCMSPANVQYILDHNPEIGRDRIEEAPNSVAFNGRFEQNDAEKQYIRAQYNLPNDRPIFIYGGNLGKPQGIEFLIKCLDANKDRSDCFFVISGDGTERAQLVQWYERTQPKNVRLLDRLPKTDYDKVVRTCDVGMIFLDHRFTIPNYPSRLLSYLENKMPVLCATDPNTDVGRIAEENGYGFGCESNSVENFTALLGRMINADRAKMGELGFSFFKDNYTVESTYQAIVRHF